MALITPEEARRVAIQAGQVFQPRTPISTRELFAGRWDPLTAVADAVGQVGLHVVIYGERGVGKTSLANIISPVLHVFDSPEGAEAAEVEPSRLVVKVNAHQSDTFSQIWRRALDEVSLDEERAVLGFFAHKVPETQRVAPREASNIPDEPDIDDIRRVLSTTAQSKLTILADVGR